MTDGKPLISRPSNFLLSLHSMKKTLFMLASSMLVLGCVSTDPKMGGGTGNTVTGAAGGANADGNNVALEKCDSTLGTLSVFEDTSLPWWHDYRRRYPDLGSTIPVIRLMIQQSNCFVVVERGRAMAAMNRERQLMQSGQLRAGSNVGGGQMVAADYTISPEIQFSAKTSTARAIGGALFGSLGSLVGGGLSKNEASTSLLLVDNRSGVQLSASIGSASNYDFSMFAGLFGGGVGGIGGGWSKTPEGKILITAFADSFNQMVKSLRNYKAQKVKGGMGKGGSLKVDDDHAPQATKGASVVPAPSQSKTYVATSTTIVKSDSSHSVRRNKNYNFDIQEYDEDAFNKYYDWLKNASPVFISLASINAHKQVAGAWGNMSWPQLLTVFIGQLDVHKVELEAWPLEARREAWRVMGKRIQAHTDTFVRNRKIALNNENLDPDLRNMLESIQLVTKQSLLPEET